jgi:putative transposase
VAVLKRAALADGLHGRPPEKRSVLHGDNGATLKATTVLATLHWLKIRPEFPASGGFKDLQAARQWAHAFVHWYNHDHRHSGIRYVRPAQRHAGQDREILAARDALYRQARQANPKRWSGKTRDWSPIGAVTLNPEREGVAAAVDAAAAEISAVAA